MELEDGGMLDHLEMFFEILDHSLESEQLIDTSWRNGPKQKEGKLILKVSDIEGIITHRFGFEKYYECSVTVQSVTQTVKVCCGNGSCSHDDELIFDIFEYYGAMKIDIVLKSRGLFSTSIIGVNSLNLHDIVLSQEKHDAGRCCRGAAVREMHNPLTKKCMDEYWGCNEYLSLGQSAHRQVAVSLLKVKLWARYVPLQRCLSCCVRWGHVTGSELHLAARYGSAKVMIELVQMLARKGLLRPALAQREETAVGRCRYNALDMSLAAGNVHVARILLQRAGHMCFLNTLYEPSTAGLEVVPVARHCNFVPHGSCVDRSYFDQQRVWEGSKDNGPEDDVSAVIDACSYGGAVHAAVQGGISCLALLLRFLRKYSSVVNGWERTQTLTDMVNWRGNRLDAFSPLMLACQLGDVDCVRALLQITEPSNTVPCVKVNDVSSRNGYTALMLACESGNVEIVNLLLSRKKDVGNELPVAADGRTCRNSAGSRSVVELYFKEKSPVSLLECLPLARDAEGRQCVAIAAQHGHAEAVYALISRGVPYTNTDLDGRTPLHWAAANGHIDVCEVIVRMETILWDHFPPLSSAPTADTVGSSFEFTSPKVKEQSSQLSRTSRLVSCSTQAMVDGLAVHGTQNKKRDARLFGYTLGKSKREEFAAPIVSLSHMTRRPSALLALDIRGNRPADLAAKNGHDAVVRLLVAAVRDVYGVAHPAIQRPPASCMTKLSTAASTDKHEGRTVSMSCVLESTGHTAQNGSGVTTTEEERLAEDAAYTFATTLHFPTPPPSPSNRGDNDEKNCDNDDNNNAPIMG